MRTENAATHEIPADFWQDGNQPITYHADKHIISSRFYDNTIPPFVDAAIERLYANIYCTLARISMYERLDDIHTFAAADEHDIVLLILFRVERDTIRIVNQQVALSQADLAYFAANAFPRYPAARRIEGYALDTRIDASTFPYPVQTLPRLEENVIQLPESPDAYMQQLGKSTRESLRRSMRKCMAQFPSCRFEVLSSHQITPRHIRELVHLTDQRMLSRNAKPYVDNADIDRIAQLSRSHGYLGIMLIDEKIVAASLCYSVGPRHFAHLAGHDPRFDAYRLGRQVVLHALFHTIAMGGHELWMLGGYRDWKSHFLARPKVLSSVTIYRSRGAALLCLGTLLRNGGRRRLSDIRRLLNSVQAQGGAGGRLLGHARAALRRLRFVLARGDVNPGLRGDGREPDG